MKFFIIGAALCVPVYTALLLLTNNSLWVVVGVLSGVCLWICAYLWKDAQATKN